MILDVENGVKKLICMRQLSKFSEGSSDTFPAIEFAFGQHVRGNTSKHHLDWNVFREFTHFLKMQINGD
jgi:hypothetical protein